jgi:4-diphosphocytidyl-2-C-methyl-D-erythritol kinase
MLALLAPAKVNLGLEIVGRRADDFHEVRTILVAVTLFDRITVARAETRSLWSDDSALATDDNLAMRAARALDVPVRIELRKRIPAAAGLGGASSDAAAVLRAISRLHPSISSETIRASAAALGSDVPFFLENRPALASGRGDLLEPMPEFKPVWFVIAAPALAIPNKTAALYRALATGDFSNGCRTTNVARKLGSGQPLASDDLVNAFQRPLYEGWPAASVARDALIDAGANAVGLSGAGPSHYAICDDFHSAAKLAAAVRKRLESGARVIVCRSVSEPMPFRFVV